MHLSIDRNATIDVAAKITIKVDPPEAPQWYAVVAASFEGFTATATLTGGRMAYTLPDDRRVQLKIAYKDANGNPAAIDGAVVWSSSDAERANVEPTTPPAADNSTVWLFPGTATGSIGAAQITARADADRGQGVKEIITVFDVEVVGGEAVAGTVEPVGELEPLP
jgi:hypothetical protein